MTSWLSSRYFFLGLFLGFILSSVAGYFLSQKARLHSFSRFFRHISLEMDYYPTAAELLATAKRKVKPDDILVLIGGSSILRGEGQNPNELWSEQLQKELGHPFKVLNYASNGAGFPAFGAVAFRMLSKDYPHIIFITTSSFVEERPIDGGKLYGYVFWDAYYKHLLPLNNNEKNLVTQLRKQQLRTKEGMEMHIMSYLDSFLYFKALWNWVGYQHVFTLWNAQAATSPFQPKRRYTESTQNIEEAVKTIAQDKKRFQSELNVLRETFVHYDNQQAALAKKNYATLFDARYRRKIVCVQAIYNPKHLNALTRHEQHQYKTVVKDIIGIMQSQDYNVIQLHHLTPEDFMDLQHLVATGGQKAALAVAAEVKKVAVREGFMPHPTDIVNKK